MTRSHRSSLAVIAVTLSLFLWMTSAAPMGAPRGGGLQPQGLGGVGGGQPVVEGGLAGNAVGGAPVAIGGGGAVGGGGGGGGGGLTGVGAPGGAPTNFFGQSKATAAATVGSFFMILASEIGDKTFFIAAIMAMRHSRLVVFSAALGALFVMTVLSAVVGHAVPQMLPKFYTHYAATLLFFVFAYRLLKEAYEMEEDGENSELEEVNEELRVMEEHKRDIESGATRASTAQLFLNSVFWQTFSLTFLAEWGDRSQIATIAMAAAQDVTGVCIGGTAGHALCTGVAVVGGRMLASKISPRSVHLLGGVLFFIFGAIALYEGPDGFM